MSQIDEGTPSAAPVSPAGRVDKVRKEPRERKDRGLIGNRWMLVGGIVYLLEWVPIIGVSVMSAGNHVTYGSDPAAISETYAHENALAFNAGWFAVVLLGRILVFVALRHAMVASGCCHPLLDFAVPAATASVVLEMAAYGIAMGGAAAMTANEPGLYALDQAGAGVNMLVAGGLGAALLCVGVPMLQSKLFPKILGILAVICGVTITLAQFFIAPSTLFLIDIGSYFVFLFWVWMIWTGIHLWRRTPRRSHSDRG